MTEQEQDIIIENITEKLKTDWCNWLYKNEPGFKHLSMDEQAEYVMCIVDYVMKYELHVPYGKAPSEKE